MAKIIGEFTSLNGQLDKFTVYDDGTYIHASYDADDKPPTKFWFEAPDTIMLQHGQKLDDKIIYSSTEIITRDEHPRYDIFLNEMKRIMDTHLVEQILLKSDTTNSTED